MSQDQFRKTEEEYYQLKGQLAAKRINRQQFEDALKKLMVQDAQGRYWVIGPESGKWYVHDGQNWVESNPTPGATPHLTPVPADSASRGRINPLWFVIGAIILICLAGAVGLAIVINQGFVTVNLSKPTVAVLPTTAPSPTLLVVLPTAVPPIVPTALPTASPVRIILTSTPVPATATTMPSPTVPIATSAPTIVPTSTPIPATSTPPTPPGLYVTGVRIEPPIPGPGEDTFFRVSFLNTTAGTLYPRWLVYIYQPGNFKNSFGETTKLVSTIPVGTFEQRIGTWKVTRGACGNYVARIAWLDDNNRTTFLNKPDGEMFELSFQMCQ